MCGVAGMAGVAVVAGGGGSNAIETDSPASPELPPYDMEVEDINDSEVSGGVASASQGSNNV